MTESKISLQVLIVDTEESQLQHFHKIFNEYFDIVTLNDPYLVSDYIQSNEVAIIIAEFHMINMSGLELLERIKSINPDISRVLKTEKLNLDIARKSINNVNTHLIIEKPWNVSDIVINLQKLLEQFSFKRQITLELKQYKSMQEVPKQKSTDELISLLISLSETSSNQDFSQLFMDAIEGLRSLAVINFEFYLENETQDNFESMIEYLSDIDLIANQFNQKILSMYITLVKAYLYLYDENFEQAKLFYNGACTFYEWFKDINIDPLLSQSINNFPSVKIIRNHNPVDDHFKATVELKIRKLLRIKVDGLVNISEKLFQLYEEQRSDVFYLIVVRDEIPVYEKKRPDSDLQVSLITGFVVALSHFLSEVIAGSGNLETISHETGVVLIHDYKEFTFVVFTLVNDIKHKVALRHFATEIYDLISVIPPNSLVTQSEQDQIDSEVDKFFGKFV